MNNKKAVKEAFAGLAPRYESVMNTELRLFWGWSYDEFVDQLIEIIPSRQEDLILDIATGTAVIPIRLSDGKKHGQKIVGLDITPTMLSFARQKILHSHSSYDIHFTCASAMEMPFKDKSFSLVTCGMATHHMDINLLLGEIKRVLKPGGVLVLSDIGAGQFWRFFPIRVVLKMLAFLYYLPAEGLARAWAETSAVPNIFTSEKWHAMAADAGFVNIEVTRMTARKFWAPAAIAMRVEKSS